MTVATSSGFLLTTFLLFLLEDGEVFKETYFVTDKDIAIMQEINLLPERTIQDYRSTYNDIRDWLRREKNGK